MMAAEMKALQDQHQREMEDRDKETQRKREGNTTQFYHPYQQMLLNILQLYTFKKKTFQFVFKVDAKETELNVAHERNECALEEMRRQMREKEKEMQSQIIKLQMEVEFNWLT